MGVRGVSSVGLVACVFAACGGADDDSAEGTVERATTPVIATTAPPTTGPQPTTTEPATTAPPTTEPATTVPETTEPPEPPIEVGLLTVDDMPEGWTIQRPAESDAAFWDQIAECAGLAPGSLGEAALGDSAVTADDFYDPSGQTGVEHVVGVANDEATAIAAMAANADEALADCYESIITANYAAGNDPTDTRPDLTISAVQVERQDLSGFESDDEMVWYTVVTTFNLGGQTIDRYVELIFLRDEQVLSELRLSNVDEPFPEDLIEPIVTRTQERMAALAEA